MRAKPVIAGQGALFYGSAMLERIIRLLTLAAMLVMPLGMASAAATVSPEPQAMTTAHHASPAPCDERGADDAAERMAQCATACTMLLAQAAGVPAVSGLVPVALALPLHARTAGHTPEADPPPPKRA